MSYIRQMAAVAVMSLTMFSLVPVAQAAPISFNYEGIVDNTGGGAIFSAFLGQTISFDVTIEDTTPDADALPFRGNYDSGVISVVVTLGGNTWTKLGPTFFRISTLAENDSFTVQAQSPITGPMIDGQEVLELLFFVSDPSFATSVILNDAIPTMAYDPADFSGPNQLRVSFIGSGFLEANAPALMAIANGVPAPAALPILGAGVLAVGALRRRRALAA